MTSPAFTTSQRSTSPSLDAASDAHPPSLFGTQPPATRVAPTAAGIEPPPLVDQLYDGFTMVFLLRSGQAPQDAEEFRRRFVEFLDRFGRRAIGSGTSGEDVQLCHFALCALVDEVILQSGFRATADWSLRPMQLQLFGEQLAGEKFFEHLESLRRGGAARVQVMEVFHMVLLLGFQGRYLIEGPEKLAWLTARLGEEIAHLRGRRAAFAPRALPPDHIVHRLRHDVPLWAVGALVGVAALAAYIGLATWLGHHTQELMAGHQQVIAATPRQAHLVIIWP